MQVTSVFFFNDTATTEIYTLSLHDALPIYGGTDILVCVGPVSGGHSCAPEPGPDFHNSRGGTRGPAGQECPGSGRTSQTDRKSTRLNSSHPNISYAVFCLKKKTYTRSVLPT